MSQENVEVLRAFFAAWNAGDMGALRELHDPSAIMHAPAGWPEPGPEICRDAIMRQFDEGETENQSSIESPDLNSSTKELMSNEELSEKMKLTRPSMMG